MITQCLLLNTGNFQFRSTQNRENLPPVVYKGPKQFFSVVGVKLTKGNNLEVNNTKVYVFISKIYNIHSISMRFYKLLFTVMKKMNFKSHGGCIQY